MLTDRIIKESLDGLRKRRFDLTIEEFEEREELLMNMCHHNQLKDGTTRSRQNL